ncbi:MAG: hypothetical protein BroJett024_38850 [Alphaproteobacteria bacterium]|nr:MAG: hypothetical protein BroJett024_38850 [Alphaproteobacteria bacterium]
MNVQSKLPTTPEEFLRWNEGREGKREFVDGKVVEMIINVTRIHLLLATRLTHQLVEQLGTADYVIGSADFGVRTPDGVRFPDVLIERTGGDWKALATSEPLLVAEILSPSSIADDFGPKARDYLAIPSLQHYLVLSQDEPCLWLWSRQGDEWRGPELFRDRTEPVFLPGLDVQLDPAALYAGIAN